MKVIKRDGTSQEFDITKITHALVKAFKACGYDFSDEHIVDLIKGVDFWDGITIEEIQDIIEETLIDYDYIDVMRAYTTYRNKRKEIRDSVTKKKQFIENYKKSSNTADATVDDNSNVANKNVGILNVEIHKEDNIETNRGMVVDKLKELYPDFDAKQYIKDLNNHIIYKHDESSFAGAIAPYCVSSSMYPFLTGGIKGIGGLSASPKNLDSFCGMYINLIFATSAMFAGAVATSEFLLYFDYFAKKEWGDVYYTKPDCEITSIHSNRRKTIRSQIHQHFQQVVYSINQPAAARGMQAAFVNFSYFDKSFFYGMFGDFYFPDGTQPTFESLEWLQKEFMQWFNEERLKTVITFPVESVALVYKDGKFEDENMARFVAEEYARGHSFFTYISDTVDSLSSCCRLKNMIQTKEFNFTNGNMGVQTGSKSVITLNLNRIIQDWYADRVFNDYACYVNGKADTISFTDITWQDHLKKYIINILERVYMYHNAYNELLWDMYDAKLLPVYSAGFIDLNKQYLTIGLNGLNQAAEFLGYKCNDNPYYKQFCQFIFGLIKEQNTLHKTKKLTFNTEQVPAESLAIKNYNWDKNDNYWVPEDTNLYASYIFKPNDSTISVPEKMILHGRDYIGDYLDGGSACHINLDHHLSAEQYYKLLCFAGEVGCQYFTFNIPNTECDECGFITKVPVTSCPKCHSKKVSWWDRVIGYMTKISNWSEGRRIEQKTRIYENYNG
jgi:ribonucleoside-triphosphate reductase